MGFAGIHWLHFPFDHPVTVIHCQKALKHIREVSQGTRGAKLGVVHVNSSKLGVVHVRPPGTWYTCGRSTDREFLVMQDGR